MNPQPGETWTETATGETMIVHATLLHKRHTHRDHVALMVQPSANAEGKVITRPPSRWVFLDRFARDWSQA